MDSKEFRVLIKHCFLMGENTTQAKEWVNKCYGTSSPSYTTVKKWYAEFKRDRTFTDNVAQEDIYNRRSITGGLPTLAWC